VADKATVLAPVRLVAAATIHGAVTGPAKRIARIMGVVALSPDGSPAGNAMLERDGTYEMRGLAPGTYQVTLIGVGAAPRSVTVREGSRERVDFALEGRGDGRILVKVRTKDGTPAGFAASVYSAERLGGIPATTTTVTARDPHAELAHLDAGPVTLLVAISDVSGLALFRENLALDAATPLEVSFTLPDPARSGTIEGSFSGSMPRGHVAAIGDGVVVWGTPQSDGTFTLENVPAGTYRVGTTANGVTLSVEHAVTVTVQAGETTAAALR
ncbi:MAG: carboxypeptidase regulatory-like domain-containing protein, partial [Planctomycetota bacterium]